MNERTFLKSFSTLLSLMGLTVATLAGEDGCKIGIDDLAINPSVVVNDLSIVTDANFGFAKTIGAILASEGGTDTAANREAFLQSMLDSFNATQFTNPMSGLAMPVDARPNEAGMSAAALLNPADPSGLHPVGVFNRLDLAPSDFSNCGEHRVVYATSPGAPNQRFFLIFEARVANPDGAGFPGCRPIAEFWASLNGMSASAQAAALENFYYSGLPGIGPVIRARNYGQPDGQVRGNIFVGFTEWQLREWLVGNFGPAGRSFVTTTVKTNPLAELYADASGGGSLDPALEESERTAFLSELETTYIRQALGVDGTFPAIGLGDAGALQMFKQDLFAGMGAQVDGRFDEFQSVSQGLSDDPAAIAPAGGRAHTAASDFLAANPLPHNRTVTSDQALARMGALSCGGCHQFSNGAEIGMVDGQPINWPSSAFFVHIDEDGVMSEALNDWFLPARRQNLKDALCDFAEPTPPVDDGYPEYKAGELVPMQPGEMAAMAAETLSREEAVDTAAARVRSAPQPLQPLDESVTPAAEPAAITDYKEVVEQLREEEAEKPGAFVRVRRVH